MSYLYHGVRYLSYCLKPQHYLYDVVWNVHLHHLSERPPFLFWKSLTQLEVYKSNRKFKKSETYYL